MKARFLQQIMDLGMDCTQNYFYCHLSCCIARLRSLDGNSNIHRRWPLPKEQSAHTGTAGTLAGGVDDLQINTCNLLASHSYHNVAYAWIKPFISLGESEPFKNTQQNAVEGANTQRSVYSKCYNSIYGGEQEYFRYCGLNIYYIHGNGEETFCFSVI